MSGNQAIALLKIVVEDEFGHAICEQRVIEPIQDPAPKRVHLEEHTFLAKLVKLWISIE